jgi:ankyrin repeat protein
MNALYKIYKDKSQKGLDLSLTEACKEGDLEVVEFLLTSPDLMFLANINEGNNDPIFQACDYGHKEIIQYLLTSSELKEHADKYFALYLCCEEDKVDIVKFILEMPGLEIDIHHDNAMAIDLAFSRKAYNVLHYLVFDMNIKKTNRIDTLIQEYNSVQVKNWFELREVNKELNKELVKTNTNTKKIKV